MYYVKLCCTMIFYLFKHTHINNDAIVINTSPTHVHRLCIFDKINLPRTNNRHYNRSKYQRSSAVITNGRSARPCFEANQTSSRQIRDIFKGFRPTLCWRIHDYRQIWHGQTSQRNIPMLLESLITLLNIYYTYMLYTHTLTHTHMFVYMYIQGQKTIRQSYILLIYNLNAIKILFN